MRNNSSRRIYLLLLCETTAPFIFLQSNRVVQSNQEKMDDRILKQHFCLQYLKAVATAAQIDLPLFTLVDHAPTDPSVYRRNHHIIRRQGIIKPTSAKYLSGFLAKKSSQRTDYDPKLVNYSIFRHHPSQLYDEVLCIKKIRLIFISN